MALFVSALRNYSTSLCAHLAQPACYVELSWVSVYEHFALMMTELRKAELKRGAPAP
jgi:hypothetical protein